MAMRCALILITAIAAVVVSGQDPLPTVYEYFTAGGIASGLTANDPPFKLNNRDLRIISGSIHYFRVHPELWRDRLRKLRALGANTVETYVAWNLHEPIPDQFDFETPALDVVRFIQLAQEEDLLVLLRPGPYICAEFEFGGLPAWLRHIPDMRLRTAYGPYQDRVQIYLNTLLSRLANRNLQFVNGGPIIGIQIENEYGHYTQEASSKEYLAFIATAFEANGFGNDAVLHFTSDNILQTGDRGMLIPQALATANLQSDPRTHIDRLLGYQPSRPVLVAEYWAGWFDLWGGNHSTTAPDEFANNLETIFDVYNGSVNFYMFHGGTNFGFTAGATDTSEYPHYSAFVTSYDYDAPLSEAGDYTEKYLRAQALIEQYQVPILRRPEMPIQSVKLAYPSVLPKFYLSYHDILARVPASAKFDLEGGPVPMEDLPLHPNGGVGSGQNFGYVAYRKVFQSLREGGRLQIGPVKDLGILLIDGIAQPLPATHGSSYWVNDAIEFELHGLDGGEPKLVDVLVECSGRLNWVQWPDFDQRKGITNGNISMDGELAVGFQVIALEFSSEWVNGLSNWRLMEEGAKINAPAMFQTTFEVNGSPTDTFIDMRGWHRGIVFVNGFNLGRYFRPGPQQTLYVPAPVLRTGTNIVTIFEQLEPGSNIVFSGRHILDQNIAK